jgi:hypothetical protein
LRVLSSPSPAQSAEPAPEPDLLPIRFFVGGSVFDTAPDFSGSRSGSGSGSKRRIISISCAYLIGIAANRVPPA